MPHLDPITMLGHVQLVLTMVLNVLVLQAALQLLLACAHPASMELLIMLLLASLVMIPVTVMLVAL
jgi:hypothetical protein